MARTSKTRRRRSAGQFLTAVDWLTAAGLKLGLLVFVVCAGYFLHGVFSGGVKEFLSLAAADKERILPIVLFAAKALQISAAVAVASIIIRNYSEDVVGYILAIGGAVGYFMGPSGFISVLGDSGVKNNPVAAIILNSFQMLSLIMFVPGVGLSARSLLLGVLEGLVGYTEDKEPAPLMWGTEEPESKRKNVLYPKCWDMSYCRPFIRKFCPAWRHRKPCWRIKAGCYCDETTILKALNITDGASGSAHGMSAPATQNTSSSAKRKRCRTCPIYALHQRRKYQLLSPLTFPFVALLFWSYFGQITQWIAQAMEKADYFMQYVSLSPTSAEVAATFGSSTDSLVVFLFVCWLAIMTVSYILRGMEYCIFKLQI